MPSKASEQMREAEALGLTSLTQEAIKRGIVQLDNHRIVYKIRNQKSYAATDPEEVVRADTMAFLTIMKGYKAKRIQTEVVGRHGDFADIVLYKDDRCTNPWLVVENKKRDERALQEAENQAFANATALGAEYVMIDNGEKSVLWALRGFNSREKERNRIGDRRRLPANYSEEMSYALIAGTKEDIKPSDAVEISYAIRKAHSVIWAGGKRDPLAAFDEWSKLMFAKVRDERYTPNGKPRGFQVGVGESESAVATRVHVLFDEAKEQDSVIFTKDDYIDLPDKKVKQVVEAIQSISFVETDSDVIGTAFEDFFGSVFRGSLGQYFTMRQIARFTVAALAPGNKDYVLDPTCGSGGFLLETLLQVWRNADRNYAGQRELERIKSDFAAQNVYGIEIHPILARICKISLLLHHDGHTNIEADKSCLSNDFEKRKLRDRGQFDVIVGNPPFGTKVEDGDEDQLDGTSLSEFVLACGRKSIQSEQVILEKSIEWLKPGGRLGMVLPDGIFNNSGEQSNCPALREWLFKNGRVLGVISLPDFAFRRSGATNKTSILIFNKFEQEEKECLANELQRNGGEISKGLIASGLDYNIFFAEAAHIGYTPSGRHDPKNDLYNTDSNGMIAVDQTGSILGEWNVAVENDSTDDRRCVMLPASKVWLGHESHGIDPKYHVYKAHALEFVPDGWKCATLGELTQRVRRTVNFNADSMKEYKVLTLSQSGIPRLREAGVGNNPPEWRGMYFSDSSSHWYETRTGDIVYSGIDLWKGSVCYISSEFDHTLVTQEYPVLKVKDPKTVNPEFLAILLRSKRFQMAFRAINTGHSNRRRTQLDDFNHLLVYYPQINVQLAWAERIRNARGQIEIATKGVHDTESALDSLLCVDDGWIEAEEEALIE